MFQKDGISTCQYLAVICILLLFVPLLKAQDLPEMQMVVYSPDYEFRDGIYMNPGMVKANSPIPPGRIVSDRNKFDNKFYNDLLKKGFIALSNDQGVREYIKASQVWGYAHKGELYIQIGNSFQRLILEGNISRFMASATTYEERELSPRDSSYYNPSYYYGPRRRPSYVNPTRNRVVYLLDFETNTLNNDSPDDLGKLLIRDSQLFMEYNALKRNQRKKRQLEFIQRYNERHPLYLPAVNTD